MTRSCIGIWDYMTGKMKFTLANSAMGSIITHAIVNEEGTFIVAAESGEILIWDLQRREVVCKDDQENVAQLFFNKAQTRCMVVSNEGTVGSYRGVCVCRSFPEGVRQFTFDYPHQVFRDVLYTSDEKHLVCYGCCNKKDHLFVHSADDGELLSTIPVKYPGFKKVSKVVPLPDKPSTVALIDVDRGAMIDVVSKKFLKSIPNWDGSCTNDGRYGLFAPPTGGMHMLDLRTGIVSQTLIPKSAEGIFDVTAIFNKTNEYVLYYHSGRKTVRAFRRKNGEMIANFRVQADLKVCYLCLAEGPE